jgi:hypothetical protein
VGDGSTGAGRGTVQATERGLRAGWHALHVRGSLREARAHFDVAYRQAQQTDDVAAITRAAIGLGGAWVHEHRGAAEAALVRQRQRRALRLAPAGSPEHLQLRLRITAEDDYAAARHDRILALLPEARQCGDPRILVSALSMAHHCLLAPDHTGARRALAQEMLEAATVSDRPGDLAMAMIWRTVDRFLEADPHAERALKELVERLHRWPHLAAEFVVEALRVMLDIRAGRLTDAEDLARQCAGQGESAGDPDVTGWFTAHLVAIRWYQGRIGDLLPYLEAHAHSPTLSTIDSSAFAALAVAAAGAGDRSRAELAVNRLGGGDLHALPRSSSWMVAVYGAIEAALVLGSSATAQAGYDLLLPFARQPLMASLAVNCFGSVEHALGLAAHGMGLPDLAARHMRAAIRANLALGHSPAAAHSRYRLGQILAGSDDRQDRDEGARERAHALAEAGRHGWGLPDAARELVEIRTATPARNEAMATASLLAPPPTAAAEPGSNVIVMHRHGRRWTLHWYGRSAEVEHGIGMLYLCVLVAQPGKDIPAVDLAAGQMNDSHVRADAALGPTQPVIDDHARRTYRRRLNQLERAIRDADGGPDEQRLARLRQEHAWITAELTTTTGPGRRRRAFTGNAERARIAVGKAIRRALGRITDADPVLGAELRRTIHTGGNCCFRPSVSAPRPGLATIAPLRPVEGELNGMRRRSDADMRPTASISWDGECKGCGEPTVKGAHQCS